MAWLSARERQSLNERDQLLTLAVRTQGLGPADFDYTAATPAEKALLECAIEHRTAVQSAGVLNEAILYTGKSTEHLSEAVVADALRRCWSLVGKPADELRAAAHDRGFPSWTAALEASREFCLLWLTGRAFLP